MPFLWHILVLFYTETYEPAVREQVDECHVRVQAV